MYRRLQRGHVKASVHDNTIKLGEVNQLAGLYEHKGKMAEAEEMYIRALRGYEKAWGLDHTSTLDTVNNLGILYADQGKLDEAEKMYQRALQGNENAIALEGIGVDESEIINHKSYYIYLIT